MLRQVAIRASAAARSAAGPAAAAQRRHMAEAAVATDKLHFNFLLPGGSIQKDAAVVRLDWDVGTGGGLFIFGRRLPARRARLPAGCDVLGRARYGRWGSSLGMGGRRQCSRLTAMAAAYGRGGSVGCRGVGRDGRGGHWAAHAGSQTLPVVYGGGWCGGRGPWCGCADNQRGGGSFLLLVFLCILVDSLSLLLLGLRSRPLWLV